MARKHTPPTITAAAFDCPYCGAFTSQHWYMVYADFITGEEKVPFVPEKTVLDDFRAESKLPREEKEAFLALCDELLSGNIFLHTTERSAYLNQRTQNLNLSRCYNCNRIAVWVHQSLVFPPQRIGPEPNRDLPDEVQRDFEEARSIVNWSPRGAAALLRLSVQKLCAFLGEKGENINSDIQSLVQKGLNPVVQKSLDVLRVIGNEAVHPGAIDLKNDRDTAIQLFAALNFIAEQMISTPRAIGKMYDLLPADKKQAIDKRDRRANDESRNN